VSEIIEIGSIRRDGGTQSRATVNQAVVDEYADAYRAGLHLPAVVVFFDGLDYWLADGFHRVLGADAAELEEIDADVRQGTRRDAVLHSCGANEEHGLRRTRADRQRAVETLLRDPEWAGWSDRAIADACRVSPSTVGAARARLAPTVQLDSGPRTNADNETRIGRDGRTIDVSGLRARAEPEPQAEPGFFRGPVVAGVVPIIDARREPEPTTEAAAEAPIEEGQDDAADEDAEVIEPPRARTDPTTKRRSELAVEGSPLIDLRCCSCEDIEWPLADLAVADPPWDYHDRHGASAAGDHYATLPTRTITKHLDRLDVARLVVWCTWPLLAEWAHVRPVFVTGGAWVKSREGEDAGHYGQGYHWAGCSEPVLIYSLGGGFLDRSVPLRSVWHEAPGFHSHKPIGWMVQWIKRWVPEGGLVLDPYAGLGSVAEAVLLAGGGRRYLGTEIDPERHADALEQIAITARDLALEAERAAAQVALFDGAAK